MSREKALPGLSGWPQSDGLIAIGNGRREGPQLGLANQTLKKFSPSKTARLLLLLPSAPSYVCFSCPCGVDPRRLTRREPYVCRRHSVERTASTTPQRRCPSNRRLASLACTPQPTLPPSLFCVPLKTLSTKNSVILYTPLLGPPPPPLSPPPPSPPTPPPLPTPP